MELWIDIEIKQWMEHQIQGDKCITSFILMTKLLFDIPLLFLGLSFNFHCPYCHSHFIISSFVLRHLPSIYYCLNHLPKLIQDIPKAKILKIQLQLDVFTSSLLVEDIPRPQCPILGHSIPPMQNVAQAYQVSQKIIPLLREIEFSFQEICYYKNL